ncbi:MAG: hypothetical protein SPL03_00045 [Succinivibrio dextrinosolvens]|nr:hypothetical protein [Succinivibrio dextrinosolvens]
MLLNDYFLLHKRIEALAEKIFRAEIRLNNLRWDLFFSNLNKKDYEGIKRLKTETLRVIHLRAAIREAKNKLSAINNIYKVREFYMIRENESNEEKLQFIVFLNEQYDLTLSAYESLSSNEKKRVKQDYQDYLQLQQNTDTGYSLRD